MNFITSKIIAEILLGIFIFTLYFNSRFKSFIGIATLFWLGAVLDLLFPDDFRMQILVSAFPILIVLTFGVREAMKFEKEGRAMQVMQISNKNKIFGLILFVIYMITKIFYFDKI